MSRPVSSERRWRGTPRAERGAVLVLVLLVLITVVALTLSLGRDVRVEVAVARERADAVLLDAIVDTASQRALAEVRAEDEAGDTLFETWRDDQARFAGVEFGGGRYWYLLTEPDPGDGREVRYGLRDTAGLLDVNTATRDQLLALPGITDEAADGIIDWRDEDDEAGEQGAESSYYVTLDPPYQAKNAPIESLDELLRIKGIDAAMLYGEDRNRNGILDPDEDDGDRSFPPDDADGQLDRGLIDYLTVFSRDLNQTHDGRARLVWADADPQELDARLGEAGLDQAGRDRVRFAKMSGQNASSLGEIVFRAGLTDPAQVAVILDQVTVSAEPIIPGRINVNTAPREVLAGLNGLEADDVDAILTRRLDPTLDLSTPAWLLGVMPLDKFAGLVDQVTARSDQFLVQIVALLDDRPRFRRVELLIDRNFVPVRVLTWRDLTGLGFPLAGERGTEHP